MKSSKNNYKGTNISFDVDGALVYKPWGAFGATYLLQDEKSADRCKALGQWTGFAPLFVLFLSNVFPLFEQYLLPALLTVAFMIHVLGSRFCTRGLIVRRPRDAFLKAFITESRDISDATLWTIQALSIFVTCGIFYLEAHYSNRKPADIGTLSVIDLSIVVALASTAAIFSKRISPAKVKQTS